VKRRCVMCATEFDAKRPSARYCSDRCRQRFKRAGAAVPPATPAAAGPVQGKSGAAARAWLADQQIDAERKPAAADLLVVADTIDQATAGGQIQFVAALARQAAALRGELTPSTTPDDPDDPPDDGQGASGDSSGDGGPERRTFDPAAI